MVPWCSGYRYWVTSGASPLCGVLEIRYGEYLWQWSRLEIRLSTFRRLIIPQKQFIIFINSLFKGIWSSITKSLKEITKFPQSEQYQLYQDFDSWLDLGRLKFKLNIWSDINITSFRSLFFLFIFTEDHSSANTYDVTCFVDHTLINWPWSLQRTHKFDLHCSPCKVLQIKKTGTHFLQEYWNP